MVRDLRNFIERVKEDTKLQEKMEEIANCSSREDMFDNCNAVAAELGYSITEEDVEAFADEYEMSDEDLDGVAGGQKFINNHFKSGNEVIANFWKVYGSRLY